MYDLTKLDALKAKLDEHRPLDAAVTASLHESLVLQWTYHSNAIEGNTLTLKETKVALEGITIGGKTLREHFEAINHRDAILRVEELVSQQQPLDEWTIKTLHQLVLKNIDADNAGRYRSVNVLISGAEHRPPQAVQVPEQMETRVVPHSSTGAAPLCGRQWPHLSLADEPRTDEKSRISCNGD